MMDTPIEQMRPDAAGRNWLVLGGYALASFSAAGLGALVNNRAIDGWYRTLAKPSWNPPDEVFAPVWTALYAAMALAAWLVWQRKQHEPARGALTLWWIQLVLNLGWNIAFFGLESPAGGLVTIAMLWLALAATTVGFFRVRRLPGWLMVPYLAWVSFASALNFAIWRLN
jgi:translocator protein